MDAAPGEPSVPGVVSGFRITGTMGVGSDEGSLASAVDGFRLTGTLSVGAGERSVLGVVDRSRLSGSFGIGLGEDSLPGVVDGFRLTGTLSVGAGERSVPAVVDGSQISLVGIDLGERAVGDTAGDLRFTEAVGLRSCLCPGPRSERRLVCCEASVIESIVTAVVAVGSGVVLFIFAVGVDLGGHPPHLDVDSISVTP